MGTTVEFKVRGTFLKLSDMEGGGPFGLEPGQWTDDTSMALCLGTSLVECCAFDPRDQMDRYLRWRDEGYLSSTGTCFDIGITVSAALDRFERTGDPMAGPTERNTAGNGSIMRLAPVVLWSYPDQDASERFAVESSRTTHGTRECLDACRLMARILGRALDGRRREEVLMADQDTFRGAEAVEALAHGSYRSKSRSDIRGSGYVVESLEAALWCFNFSESFEEAVLMAANLGNDADTTAAVTGQVAGAFYGQRGIPTHWLDRLTMRAEIEELALRLIEGGPRGETDTEDRDDAISP